MKKFDFELVCHLLVVGYELSSKMFYSSSHFSLCFILQLKELWEAGKLSPKTKLWSQGMDGWRALQQVPQLRWTLLAKGSPVLNESELAAQILEVLIKVCQYFPSRLVFNKMVSCKCFCL